MQTMNKLEQIKNTVTANGMREWTDERVSQAMREYADQQNAELDKMGEHLSAENSDLSSQIEGLKYDKERLRERVKELEGALTATLNVARACDRGRFVNILDKAEKTLKK